MGTDIWKAEFQDDTELYRDLIQDEGEGEGFLVSALHHYYDTNTVVRNHVWIDDDMFKTMCKARGIEV